MRSTLQASSPFFDSIAARRDQDAQDEMQNFEPGDVSFLTIWIVCSSSPNNMGAKLLVASIGVHGCLSSRVLRVWLSPPSAGITLVYRSQSRRRPDHAVGCMIYCLPCLLEAYLNHLVLSVMVHQTYSLHEPAIHGHEPSNAPLP